jgi:beta-lactamase class A
MLEPDRLFYGASVPKIAILLAYFEEHPEFATDLPAETRHELGLMIKRSSNELAAKYSQQVGLAAIRKTLDKYNFYDASRGGGIWVGKHYGITGERIGDPVGDHSHAATVRQLLRFCLLLDQGRLVSPAASRTMLEIFQSPDIRHEKNKFVKGLEGFPVEVLRKSGSWEDWLHDLAIVKGDGQYYILTALTRHPQGDEFLNDFARAVHEELKK